MTYELATIPDAFAQIGFGLTNLADERREFPDHLLVAAFDVDFRVDRKFDGDAGGERQLDRVGISDREDEGLFVFLRSTEADTFDVEDLFITFGDSFNHVVQQSPRGPVKGAVLQ